MEEYKIKNLLRGMDEIIIIRTDTKTRWKYRVA